MQASRLRIGLVSDWFPPRRGGIEHQLARLASGLASRGHSVRVITSTPGAASVPGVDVRRIAPVRLPGLDVACDPRLIGLVRSELDECDLVHAHVSVVSPVAWSGVAAARGQLPTVVTFHSVLRWKRWLLAAARGLRAFEHPVVWTAVSRMVAEQASGALGATVGVLPNGIHLAFWRSAVPPRNAVVTVVSVGRLQRKKRPRVLLDAFRAAAERTGVTARLVFVGDGPERPALERQARAAAATLSGITVDFRGWCDAEATRRALREADVFALAAEREAFGIAALEARAAGLPVIAMRRAGCAEFLDGDASAVLCDDEESLTRALASALTSRGGRLSPDAPAALAAYDWPRVLDTHEATYATALAQSQR